jgi:hypothetical protein
MGLRRLSPGSALAALVVLAALASATAAGRAGHEWIGPDGPAFMRAPVNSRAAGRQALVPTASFNITRSASDNVDPVWSPDGTKIAFSSNRDGAYTIYIARRDGSHPDTAVAFTPKKLTGLLGGERYPAWSPGGADLAYVRGGALCSYNLRTGVETSLGGGLRSPMGLAFSPDGSRLAFAAKSPAGDYNLYWVALDPGSPGHLRNGTTPGPIAITNDPRDEVDPHWFPHSQVVFASNATGSYDLHAVTAPGPYDTPPTLGAGSLLLGGAGDQRYPAWVKPGGVPGFTQPYYVLYSDNTNGRFDLKVADVGAPDPVPTQTVFSAPGDKIQAYADFTQDALHNACVYAGTAAGSALHDLFVIDMVDNSPPILGDGITPSLPTVYPQRGFPGSTVTITARVFDRGSGVAAAPVDADGDGVYDSGVIAVLRVADLPVYVRQQRNTEGDGAAAGVVGAGNGIALTQNQIEADQFMVDAANTAANNSLITVNPTDPGELGATPGASRYDFDRLAAIRFAQRVGLPMYDDGTHGDATAGDRLYTCRWTAPAEAHDYYVDIVPIDQRGNLPLDVDLGESSLGRRNPLRVGYLQGDATSQLPLLEGAMQFYCLGYDHVAGFTTRQIDVTRRVLFVSDYGCGQKFQAADFAASDTTALTRYWPVVLPTEHYWLPDDDNPNGSLPTAHPLFYRMGTAPVAVEAVRLTWGLGWWLAGPGIFPRGSVPGEPSSSGFFYEQGNSGAPFGGPAQQDGVAVWRVLCRGPLDAGTLNSYTPLPLAPIENSPIPAQDAEAMVVWTSPYCGDVFAQQGTLLDAATQALLRGFVNAGGRLLVSGQDIAWALTKDGTQASPFLQQVLRATYVTDFPLGFVDGARCQLTAAAAQSAVEGQIFQAAGNPVHNSMTLRWDDDYAPDDLAPMRLAGSLGNFAGDACPNVWFTDDIAAAAGGTLTYSYAVGGAGAMVRYVDATSGARVVYAAFGLESLRNDYEYNDHGNNIRVVDSLDHRMRFMTNVSDYFRTGALLGKVVGPDGAKPVSGVTVVARRGAQPNGTILGRAVTLADGTYLIKGLTVGVYTVTVQSDQFAADHRPVQGVFGGQISQSSDLSIRLLRFETGNLLGTVSDPDNKPLPGVVVKATREVTGTNPYEQQATSDANGQYSLSLLGGDYTLTAAGGNYAAAPLTGVKVTAGTDTRRDIKLAAAPGTLSGTVSDGTQALKNATVVVSSKGSTAATLTTDTNGAFTTSVPAGSYDLAVSATGYQTVQRTGVVVTSGQNTSVGVTLTPVPPGSLVGLVSMQGSNQPVGAVTIQLLAGGGVVRTTATTATTTTSGGATYNYRFDNVAAGVYDVKASGQGFAAQTLTSVTVNTGRTTSGVDFLLQPLHVFVAGVSMSSTPFDYGTAVPDIQSLLDDDANPATNLRMATWDPTIQQYKYYPHAPAKTFLLGRGYFLKLDKNVALTREGVRASTSPPGYSIPLTPGWNLIGAPYEFPVDFFGCQVSFGGSTYGLQEAITRGLINGSLFTLNFGQYQQVYRLDPYTSYWLRAYQNVSLIVPPTELRSVSGPPALRQTPDRGGWAARLLARTSDGRAASASFGMAAGSAAVYDPADRAQPPRPPVSGCLELSFPHDDWGRFAGRYNADFRALARGASWTLEVASDQPNDEVALSWPDLGTSVPAGWRVVLTDPASGACWSLRHSAGAVVKLRGTEARRLTLSVESDADRAAIVALAWDGATRGGGGSVSLTLSGPLRLSATVSGLNGRLVRTLARNELRPGGLQTIGWDGRDDEGRPVPAGTYRLAAVGTDELGAVVRAARVIDLRR